MPYKSMITNQQCGSQTQLDRLKMHLGSRSTFLGHLGEDLSDRYLHSQALLRIATLCSFVGHQKGNMVYFRLDPAEATGSHT
jgi:hypothetical protein